jgi:hypothetical protein
MAVLVDQVCIVGLPLLTYRCLFENEVESEAWPLWLFDLVVGSRALRRRPAGYDLFLAISRALFERQCPLTDEEFTLMCDLLIADLEYVCESRRGFGRMKFADQLSKGLPPTQTQEIVKWSDWS